MYHTKILKSNVYSGILVRKVDIFSKYAIMTSKRRDAGSVCPVFVVENAVIGVILKEGIVSVRKEEIANVSQR